MSNPDHTGVARPANRTAASPWTPLPTAPTPLPYPESRTDRQEDSYHGTVVQDPYRWLEDDRSAETEAWVKAQNVVTEQWFRDIPWRSQLRARVEALVDFPRVGLPIEDAGWILTPRNDGLQNQSVWYAQRGPGGTPSVLLDPNGLDEDGTTRVGALALNRAGTHVAYMLSAAGSDWQEIRIRDMHTRADLADRVRWVKVSGIAWWGDGFFYSRYPAPGDHALSERNERHQVWYHTLGTAQEHDRLIFDDAEHAQRFHTVATTRDERFAVLYISDRGQGRDGDAFRVMDLQDQQPTFREVWNGFDDQFRVVDHVDGHLLVFTTYQAPNGRVVRINPQAPAPDEWQEVIAEQPQPLQQVSTGGGRLFAHYLQDVTTVVYHSALDGTDRQAISLPSLGTAVGFEGEAGAKSLFFVFTSFTAPATVYRYELATGESEPYESPSLPFDPSQFETRQVFATSRDGTRIPMFLVHKRGLQPTANHPTLLYGYGGFNVTLLPAFSAARVAFLEQGGVYVQANLRGGGEYGESWHKQGMKRHKQNVFDDAIACAEWLVEHQWTSPAQLAVQGGSNGGLLVGALMTQRPDLFAVALPSVGVMDMLRFQQFTIGWNWIADYGSSDNPDDFRTLFAYSPLHNLRDGVQYPATLITTGDHDDRVVPAHSFKYAARLQAAHAGPAPVLIRVETQSGHGSSSLTKGIDEVSDVYSFLFANLGVVPRFDEAADARVEATTSA